ncbi:MAG: hypothetical protein LC657_01995, partial [Desulfobacteraceae bacterium]|nr:hypothetical protein [Desulfobacteraceae bacterium]
IAKRLGMDQKTIHNHLGKMAALPNFLNGDLSMGFTVAQVAEKDGMVSYPYHSGASAIRKPIMDQAGKITGIVGLARDITDPAKKAAAGGTETILLVEDEPTILRMTRLMLEGGHDGKGAGGF